MSLGWPGLTCGIIMYKTELRESTGRRVTNKSECD